jgi:predicted XRE-type DNA-binding protein
VAGSWRQILWAETQGIPKALGLTTRDWVQQRLGGYVQMSIPERREAVKELNGNGHSTRQIAEVVGASQTTIVTDIAEQKNSETPHVDVQKTDTDSDAEQKNSPPWDDPPPEKSQAAKDREVGRGSKVQLPDSGKLKAQIEGDAVSYILSSNIQRRHMTKGQRAMAVARIFATNNLTQQEAAKSTSVSQSRIAFARTVLKLAPDHADSVLSGATSLDAAYEIAQERKRAADSTESRLLNPQVRRPAHQRRPPRRGDCSRMRLKSKLT